MCSPYLVVSRYIKQGTGTSHSWSHGADSVALVLVLNWCGYWCWFGVKVSVEEAIMLVISDFSTGELYLYTGLLGLIESDPELDVASELLETDLGILLKPVSY